MTSVAWPRLFLTIGTALVALAPARILALAAALPEKIDFNRDVRPILSENCFKCHGFDEKSREADRRLDTRAGALAENEGIKAIVPGKLSDSDLHIRVHSSDRDEKMPPPKSGKTLTPRQIAILDKWIEQGALYDVHWAFKPPVRPHVQKIAGENASDSPIDAFIRARLATEGLAPAPAADKPTLIRRVTLDLTGLPPTPAEIDAFVADQSPDAYEKVVDRLLASPHFGEQWGRHWLDAARYADTNGFEKDAPRSIWPYRDWVIQAVNSDMPFDQFTIEQLAGDLRPNATLQQRVASGFLRNSMLNEEGGVDPEQFRTEQIIDRVETVGRAYLGLTIQCAQCHDHKYDPITQREYFQFYSFLNNDEEAQMDVPNSEQQRQRADILTKVAAIEDKLIAETRDLPQRIAEWEKRMQAKAGDWVVFPDAEPFGSVGVKFEKLADGSFIQRGDRQDTGLFTVTVKTPLKGITGFRVELLTDPTLPLGGPGIAPNGNCVLTDFVVKAARPDGSAEQKVELTNATADFSQPDFTPDKAIDGDEKQTGWGIDEGPAHHADRKAVFQAKAPVGFDEGTKLTFTLTQNYGKKHVIGRFRIAATTAPDPKADPLSTRVREIIATSAAERTPAEDREVFRAFRTTESGFAEANQKIAELFAKWPIGASTLTLAERVGGRETRVFKRGDWQKPGERVEAGVPSILPPLPPHEPRTRLLLAKWLVSAEQPTVARVLVNRFWQAFFGNGLAESVEDFGFQGDAPSHPELLDWLAREFMEPTVQPNARPWSVKALVRLIATSATYRQSSRVSEELYTRDQFNRLLARGPRYRVAAENVRDIALAASGLLSRKIGGPSVFPPIPEGVLALSFGTFDWKTSEGEDRYRRGLYTFWKRANPYPSMAVFDAPAAEKSCSRRTRSNTPLQALTTLNDAAFHECAQALALRISKETGVDEKGRVSQAFRLCTGRVPDERELASLLRLLESEKRTFEQDTAQAITVAFADPAKLPKGINVHHVAAWTMVSRVLLNLDETLTKE